MGVWGLYISTFCSVERKSDLVPFPVPRHHFDPARTVMIGDRLDTDILFGKSGGVSTLLVLTGVTKQSDIEGPTPSPIVPDYVLQSVGDLVDIIGEEARN